MFNGLFQYNIITAAVAAISIILAAVYTLNMVQKIWYGSTSNLTENAHDSSVNINVALIILVLLILVFGFYPQPMIQLTSDTAKALVAQARM